MRSNLSRTRNQSSYLSGKQIDMIALGLIEVGGERLDYMPVSADGWKLHLAAKNRGQLERALSNPKLDAVAILGLSPKKTRLAEKALVNKKHVLVDFPAAEAFQRAAKPNKIATRAEQRIYSPNLLRIEPGLRAKWPLTSLLSKEANDRDTS
jgi:hypothetical protein